MLAYPEKEFPVLLDLSQDLLIHEQFDQHQGSLVLHLQPFSLHQHLLVSPRQALVVDLVLKITIESLFGKMWLNALAKSRPRLACAGYQGWHFLHKLNFR